MRKLFAILGLAVAGIIALAAYPFVQVDDGRILVTDGKIQFAAAGITATGGTITNYAEGGTNFQAHIFTNVGTTNFVVSGGSLSCDALVVAGGGGGGAYNAGAGGGGGGFYSTNSWLLTADSYTVIVGTGGLGGQFASLRLGSNGDDSVFSTVTAYGGGGGGCGGGVGLQNGLPGGCGGGAGGADASSGSGGAGTNGQGYAGGNNVVGGQYPSGGGGGSAAVGANGSGAQCGAGGAGLSNNISGTYINYGGGGGGAEAFPESTRGLGGLGGGGKGGTHDVDGGAPGTNGLGGGGGGGVYYGQFPGGAGGSGIVIVRYAQ